MKRKTLIALTLIITALCILAACTPTAGSGGPTATATDLPRATPDVSMATPEIGTAQRPRSQGSLPLLLYSLPDDASAISGEIFAGDEGLILGLDAGHNWVLVKFGDTIGWTPVNTLALRIAQ